MIFIFDLVCCFLKDFPEVNWVIQLDCPEDVATYIHRAGRTARYQKGGECLLVVRPPELKIIEYLESGKIPISEIKYVHPDLIVLQEP
jgi:ATP-dependent RNA helicase DDX10/DBP4